MARLNSGYDLWMASKSALVRRTRSQSRTAQTVAIRFSPDRTAISPTISPRKISPMVLGAPEASAVDDVQEAVDEEVHVLGRVALGEERLAPIQVDPFEARLDELVLGPVDLAEVAGQDLQPLGAAEPLADDVEEAALHLRMPRQDSLHIGGGQPGQSRFFSRRHRRVALAAHEQGDLPDQRARPHPARPWPGAAGLFSLGQEQALLDQVHGVGGIALPEQDLAFFHVDPVDGAGHILGGLRAQAFEQLEGFGVFGQSFGQRDRRRWDLARPFP